LRIARAAPVSSRVEGRASAAIAFIHATADCFAENLRGIGDVPRDAADERSDSGVETLLLFIISDAGAAFPKPLAGGGVEDGGDGGFAFARFALELLLELGGDTPAVDFSLHALQCSALGYGPTSVALLVRAAAGVAPFRAGGTSNGSKILK